MNPDEIANINFEVPIRILAFYDEDMKFVIQKTPIDILIGTSSDNILYKETVSINKEEEITEKVFSSKVSIL